MLKVQERHRHYQWLRNDRTAWRLLGAETAPLILAFLGELFSEVSEVSIDRAKTELEIYLSKLGSGEAGPAVAARSYINQWVDANYLREQSQKLTLTSVTQTALQFVESIGRRDMMVTASHLETVNQEMGRLLVQLSPDIGERSRFLEEQIEALEKAKKRLLEGHVEELTHTQKRERVRHLYTLAVSLSQDFRLLEEEMRLHEIAIRQKVLEEQDSRGDVLVAVLDAEDLMHQSPAGQAFDGFYTLLGDDERSDAFRGQIRRLMALGISEFLSPDETRTFMDLVTHLMLQSERVIARRRSATESLRAYIQSGVQREQRAVDRLLKQAERLASAMQSKRDIEWHGDLPIMLNTGKLRLSTPMALLVTMPEESSSQGPVEECETKRTLDLDTLAQFNGMRIVDVAARVRDVLRRSGARTLGDLTVLEPIRGGVEEVVALIRIAHSVGATHFEGASEKIFFTDENNKLMRATVPTLLLSAEDFPEDLYEMDT